jgi:hypothetical protein
MTLKNTSKVLPYYTASHPESQKSHSQLREPRIPPCAHVTSYDNTKRGFDFNILISESGDILRIHVRYIYLLERCDLNISVVSVTCSDSRSFPLPLLPSGYGVVRKFVCFIIRNAKQHIPLLQDTLHMKHHYRKRLPSLLTRITLQEQ